MKPRIKHGLNAGQPLRWPAGHFIRVSSVFNPWLKFCLLILLALASSRTSLRAADRLDWHAAENRVEADVSAWPLARVLEEVTAATGWQVFVEPNSQHTVSARFKNQPAADALGLLLGNLNFALLPQAGGPTKLFVFRTSAQEATQLVKAPPKKSGGTSKPIANELLVTLKPGANIDDLAKKLGAKVKGRIDDLHAYRLQFPDEAAAQAARDTLAADSSVASVDNNYNLERPVGADTLAASSSLPFSLKPTASTDTSRTVVGLVDTGVQALDPKYAAFLLPAVAIDSEYKPGGNTPLHGSSMAETLLRGLDVATDTGVPSSVRVLPVDVYGANPTTTTFDVAWGISKAVQGGATIINLSLGSDGSSGILQTIIQNSKDQGVVFFAAAGNTPTSAPTYPAAYPEVTAVTAGDKQGNLASYANYGSFVDVVGPGISIVQYGGKTWMVSGTSAATAFMSGMAAGTVATTGKTAAQVESKLRQTFTFTGGK
ncbi:MAG: S8 family serine peptidase [Verrucomicrobia bacterium]|nr:S8 family serine peptidase [Verrucomicrobiota bacterium]